MTSATTACSRDENDIPDTPPGTADAPAGTDISRGRAFSIAAVLLLVHCLLAYSAAAWKGGITYDEHAHLPAGVSYWLKRDYRLNPEHPPLPKLIAAAGALTARPVWPENDANWNLAARWKNQDIRPASPSEHQELLRSFYAQWEFGGDWLYEANGDRLGRIMAGSRIAMLLVSVGLGCAVFTIASSLAGYRGGLYALLLYSFCPNFLAHAPLATTDICYSLFLILFMGGAVEYLHRGGEFVCKGNCVHVVTVIIGAAGACLSKYSAPGALACTSLLILLFSRGQPGERRGGYVRSSLAGLCLCGLACLALCEIFYLVLFGEGFFAVWVGGFRLVTSKILMAERYFFWGGYGGRSVWYYPVTVLLKTSLPVLILVCAGFASILRARGRSGDLRVYAYGLFIAWYSALVVFTFPCLGVRYLFPVLAVAYAVAGAGLAAPSAGALLRIARVVLLAVHVAVAFIVWPDHMSYMNEASALRGKEFYLGDSNLDWGENLPRLKRWMDANEVSSIRGRLFGWGQPEYYGITIDGADSTALREARRGDIAVFSTRMIQFRDDARNHILLSSWVLRDVIGNAYWIFEKVGPDQSAGERKDD